MSFPINYAAPANKPPENANLSKDVQLSSPPEDSISALAWSPTVDHLAVASWDDKVTLYNVTQNRAGQKRFVMDFDGPVLDCAWSPDGLKIVGASADNTARLIDLSSPQAMQLLAVHDAPIRSVLWFQGPGNTPMVVTGSWDKTIRYWDLRQAMPAATVSFPERIYSMDVKGELLVVATADRQVGIVDLTNPTVLFKTMESPLQHQTRVVRCFADGRGFAVGSIGGRCGVKYIDEKDESRNIAFKCHRHGPTPAGIVDIHAVNAISFHPIHGTFSTAGSDGCFHFWDKDEKARLKNCGPVDGPISATAFNRDGKVFAYAISYDWSKGHAYNTRGLVNKVILHPIAADECAPKGQSNNKRGT